MPILRQLHNKIKTIKLTKKMTNSMHIVSASKMQKIKKEKADIETYYNIIARILNCIIINYGDHKFNKKEKLFLGIKNVFFQQQTSNIPPLLLIVILSSERGLCGGFNNNLLKKVKHDIANSAEDFRLIIYGKKAYENLRKEYESKIITNQTMHHNIFDLSMLLQQTILQVTEEKNSNYHTCRIYYNESVNVTTQQPNMLTLFPIGEQLLQFDNNDKWEIEGDKILQPSMDLYFLAILFKIMTIHKIAEESARMISMGNATKNADKIIKNLTLKANKSRQENITKELIEIISSTEAILE